MFDPSLLNSIDYLKNPSFSLCDYMPAVLEKSEKNGERASAYGKSEIFDDLKQKAMSTLANQMSEMQGN